MTGPSGSERKKLWLVKDQVNMMLDLAKAKPRDYWIMRLGRYGLRLGEIVGNKRLHGIRGMDLRADGVWIRGKGGGEHFIHLPRADCSELVPFAGKPEQRIFSVTSRLVEYFVKDYARKAGVEDWKYMSPHRLRAFFATDLKDRGQDGFTIRDLMRHKSIQTTNLYVGPPTPKQQAAIIASLD